MVIYSGNLPGGNLELTGNTVYVSGQLIQGKLINADTDLITSYIATSTTSSTITSYIVSSVLTSEVSYINGMMQVLQPSASNLTTLVNLSGTIQLSSYIVNLSIDYLLNTDTPIEPSGSNTFDKYSNLRLPEYPNLNQKYLTTNLVINADASRMYFDQNTLIPYLSSNAIVNTKGGISNFPNVEYNQTGILTTLIPNYNNTSSTLNFYQSYVCLSQTLVNNYQQITWSKKTHQYFDTISYVSNSHYTNTENEKLQDSICNSHDLYFIFTDTIVQTSTDVVNSRNIKTGISISYNSEGIGTDIAKYLKDIINVLNNLPKNFYNRDIHIIFNISSTTENTKELNIYFDAIQKISNLFNCNIYIQNINPEVQIIFSSVEHTIFEFSNLDHLYLKNIKFQSNIYESNANSFETFKNKHMHLIKCAHIKYIECINCEFDNKVPRFTEHINMFFTKNSLLAYPTHSLVFLENSKLVLNNCFLKNSNQGVIAYCNSDVQYLNNTDILFRTMLFAFNSNNDFISGCFTYISGDLPITKADYEELSSNILNYSSELKYLTFQPVINYVAGNSICNMFSDYTQNSDNHIWVYTSGDTSTKQKLNFNYASLQQDNNFILGMEQAGSIFNHSHKNLIEKTKEAVQITSGTLLSTDTNSQLISGISQMLKTITPDPCIGMANLQLPLNLFQTYNSKDSIGYTAIGYDNSHVYPINILTQNLPPSIYDKISIFYNNNFDLHINTYSSFDKMCITNNLSSNIFANDFCNNDLYAICNNGQFWLNVLSGKSIIPTMIDPYSQNFKIIKPPQEEGMHVEVSANNIIYAEDLSSYQLLSTNIVSNICYNNMLGTYFTDQNACNINYMRLIKNYFSLDNDLYYWSTPANNISSEINTMQDNMNYPSIGLLTRTNLFNSFEQKLQYNDINISDRYNYSIRHLYSNTASNIRYIPAQNQICSGAPIFCQLSDDSELNSTTNLSATTFVTGKYRCVQQISGIINGKEYFKFEYSTKSNLTTKHVYKYRGGLTSVFPNATIIPTVNSKYDFNLPFPQSQNMINQIYEQPYNYQTAIPPSKYYGINDIDNIDNIDNVNLHELLIANGATTTETNNINIIDFTNYDNISSTILMYAKTGNSVVIPRLNKTYEYNVFNPLSGQIASGLAITENSLSGLQSLTCYNDINKFKQ